MYKATNKCEPEISDTVLNKPATFNREIWNKQSADKILAPPVKVGFNKAAWKHDGSDT